MLKTTGRISLAKRKPEDLAALIIKKLEESGIELSARFSYSDEAKADVDFPRPKGKKVSKLLDALKSHDWYTQRPAISEIFELDWKSVDKNEIFVLGRNICQCAHGGERRAIAILDDLRAELAKLPADAAAHLLNGMLFEVYFNKTGEFRGHEIKGKHLDKLLKLQTVKKFTPSIAFIRKALQPYRSHLPFLPSPDPETVEVELTVKKSDPPLVKSLSLRGCELLSQSDEDDGFISDVWKLSFVKFTAARLKERLSTAWNIPPGQLTIKCNPKMDDGTEYRLPKGYSIAWPEEGIS